MYSAIMFPRCFSYWPWLQVLEQCNKSCAWKRIEVFKIKKYKCINTTDNSSPKVYTSTKMQNTSHRLRARAVINLFWALPSDFYAVNTSLRVTVPSTWRKTGGRKVYKKLNKLVFRDITCFFLRGKGTATRGYVNTIVLKSYAFGACHINMKERGMQ